MAKALPTRQEDYSLWYNELVKKADLAEHSDVRGCMVIKPYGYSIWEKMQQSVLYRVKDTTPFQRRVYETCMRRGRGIAIGFKACVSPTTSLAAGTVNADGSCIVYCSTADMGQGSDTAMAQIAGEVLHMAAEAITVVHSDTDVTPYDMATLGSRSLYHMGNAVKLAAEDARRKLDQMRAELGVPADAEIGDIFRKKYGMQAGNVTGTGSFIPSYQSPDANGLTDNATPFWMVGASGVELEVDTETGAIKVHKIVTIQDAGRVIDKLLFESQLLGGAIVVRKGTPSVPGPRTPV